MANLHEVKIDLETEKDLLKIGDYVASTARANPPAAWELLPKVKGKIITEKDLAKIGACV